MEPWFVTFCSCFDFFFSLHGNSLQSQEKKCWCFFPIQKLWWLKTKSDQMTSLQPVSIIYRGTHEVTERVRNYAIENLECSTTLCHNFRKSIKNLVRDSGEFVKSNHLKQKCLGLFLWQRIDILKITRRTLSPIIVP